jgi:transcriptional regulator with XRE-family HTH domain
MSGEAANLGQSIRTLRESLGMTQEKFSELAGLSLKHLGEIERGRGNPTFSTLVGLAKALNVTLAELVAFSDDQEHKETTSIEIRSIVEKQDQPTRLKVLKVLKAMLPEE